MSAQYLQFKLPLSFCNHGIRAFVGCFTRVLRRINPVVCRSLRLAKNRLSGPALPGALLTLANLRQLDLSENRDLTSTIPATVTVRCAHTIESLVWEFRDATINVFFTVFIQGKGAGPLGGGETTCLSCWEPGRLRQSQIDGLRHKLPMDNHGIPCAVHLALS